MAAVCRLSSDLDTLIAMLECATLPPELLACRPDILVHVRVTFGLGINRSGAAECGQRWIPSKRGADASFEDFRDIRAEVAALYHFRTTIFRKISPAVGVCMVEVVEGADGESSIYGSGHNSAGAFNSTHMPRIMKSSAGVCGTWRLRLIGGARTSIVMEIPVTRLVPLGQHAPWPRP